MPRFYLHVRKSDILVEDFAGGDFLTAEAARDEAIVAAREIMGEQIRRGELPEPDNRFEITDSDGHLVLTVSFREALAPKV
jgi:hypothetical protein